MFHVRLSLVVLWCIGNHICGVSLPTCHLLPNSDLAGPVSKFVALDGKQILKVRNLNERNIIKRDLGVF